MEIYKTEPLNLEDVANALDPPKPRDVGRWHVSNLLESAKLITKGDTRYSSSGEVPANVRTLGYIGRIWEAAVDAYIREWVIERGGTYIPDVVMEKDDIVASLDGIMMLPKECTYVVEIKLRFSRSNEIPFRHQQQILAYCAVLNTNLACYVDAHIANNPPEAFGAVRFLKFTQQEIDENWQMIMQTKVYLESNGYGPGNPRGNSEKSG